MARMRTKKNCTSGCPTGGHKSWGECARAKNLKISPNVNDNYSSRQKAWNRELDSFENATRQGVMPAGTKQHQIDKAMREAENVSN